MADLADDKIQLVITDKHLNKKYKFKAYLEKSDIQVKILDTNLQYAPISYTNNTQYLKLQYTVDFSFNVFAENKGEAEANYDKLHDLLGSIKPNYNYLNNQLLTTSGNIFGLLSVSFAGLPKLSRKTDSLDIYLTNFIYSMNKEMGFIDLNDGRLTPIAYKVDISGRVLLSIDEAVNAPSYSEPTAVTGVTGTEILTKVTGGDQAYRDTIYNTAKNIIGEEKLAALPQAKIEQIFKEVKKARDAGAIDEKGNPSEWNTNGTRWVDPALAQYIEQNRGILDSTAAIQDPAAVAEYEAAQTKYQSQLATQEYKKTEAAAAVAKVKSIAGVN